MYYMTTQPSPVGLLTMAADGENLVGLWIEGQKYFGAGIANRLTRRDDLPIFDATKSWLKEYFAGDRPAISDLPLAPSGSEFRLQVWRLLCEIPYGELTTYGILAKKMAEQAQKERMSSQAVGGAVGHNPISIIIPCHRVVGATGSLTGYAGGIDKKIALLTLEKAPVNGLFIPKRGTAL